MKADYDACVAAMRRDAATVLTRLEHLFGFVEKVWTEGQELLILVTEMTANWYTARFIARYGCESYYRHSEELMFYERQTEIIQELTALDR